MKQSLMRTILSSRIAWRLTSAILIAGLLVTGILTGTQLYRKNQQESDRINKQLRYHEANFVKSLAKAPWDVQMQHLDLLLGGIVLDPSIEYAGLFDKGRIVSEAGERRSQNFIEREIQITYQNDASSFNAGTLHLVASLEPTRANLWEEARVIFASISLMTFLFAAIALLSFHLFVNRHLLAMVDYLRTPKLKKAAAPSELRLQRTPGQQQDEFDQLVEAINVASQEEFRSRVELRDHESRFILANQAGASGVWERNLQTDHVYFSPEYLSMIGLSKENTYDFHVEWMSRLHPEDRERVLEQFKKFRAGEDKTYENEYRLRHENGSYLNLIARGTERRDAHGKRTHLIGVVIDVTDSRKLEASNQAAHRQLEEIIANVNGVVWEADPQTFSFSYVSAQSESILGYKPECWLEERNFFANHIHPEDTDTALKYCLAQTNLGRNHYFEYRMIAADGRIVWMADTVTVRVRDGRPYLLRGIMIDITERKQEEESRKQLEAKLQETQKNEALGTLAGGIAHDFNNLLAAIIGNVEMIREDLGPNHPNIVNLADIDEASQRSRDMIGQILAFSRRQPQQRRVIDLREVVETTAKLMRVTIPASIEIVISLSSEAPNVTADRTQISQVLMNLCTNAWHAMEGKAGRVEICLDSVAAEIEPSIVDRSNGRCARLTVRDNGKGMDERMLSRVFDPFFTTKPVGHGTGLGLSVVQGIVKSHGANIKIESSPGKGTAIYLVFPGTPIKTEQQRSHIEQLFRGDGQCILYLDDEQPLVSLATRTMSRYGYQVRGFTHPDKALEAFFDDPEHFDMMVTDLNMPGTSGIDVAREVLLRRPTLPVLLASGYITEELRAKAQEIGIRGIIDKPWTAEEFLSAVKNALATEQALE